MTREQLRDTYWPAIADVLHMPLAEIDRLTVAEFDQAVSYVKQKAGGVNRGQ